MARQYSPDVAIARLTVDASMQQFNALMAASADGRILAERDGVHG